MMMWRLGRKAVIDHPHDRSIRKAYRALRRELRRSGRNVDTNRVWACLLHLYPDIATVDTHAQANWEAIQRRIAARADERGRIERPRARRMSRPQKIASVMILIMLLAATIAQAAGINIWRYFIQWMDDHVIVTINQEARETGGAKSELTDNAVWGHEFLEALERNGLYPALPTWIPDGYVVDAVFEDVNDWLTAVISLYGDGKNEFRIDVMTYDEDSMSQYYEHDDEYTQNYVVYGKTFYLTRNMERTIAFWIDNTYSITITGNLSFEELKRMIDSMFTEV